MKRDHKFKKKKSSLPRVDPAAYAAIEGGELKGGTEAQYAASAGESRTAHFVMRLLRALTTLLGRHLRGGRPIFLGREGPPPGLF